MPLDSFCTVEGKAEVPHLQILNSLMLQDYQH